MVIFWMVRLYITVYAGMVSITERNTMNVAVYVHPLVNINKTMGSEQLLSWYTGFRIYVSHIPVKYTYFTLTRGTTCSVV